MNLVYLEQTSIYSFPVSLRVKITLAPRYFHHDWCIREYLKYLLLHVLYVGQVWFYFRNRFYRLGNFCICEFLLEFYSVI